jgi:hypothetical protein
MSSMRILIFKLCVVVLVWLAVAQCLQSSDFLRRCSDGKRKI